MSRQLDLVVQGVLGTHPSVVRTATGKAFCHFRVATTPSYRTDLGEWRDGPTQWFTGKAWGGLAENLGRSLHKGDPVVLVGRLSQEPWVDDRGQHLDNVLTISCGGHDLTRGESRFMRISHAVTPRSADSPSATDDGGAALPSEDAASAPSTAPSTTGGRAPSGGPAGAPTQSAGAPAAEGSAGQRLSDTHWLTSEPETSYDSGIAGAAVPADAGDADELDYVLADAAPSS